MLLHKAIATVLGLGMAPKAPGTFGAFGAVLVLFSFFIGGINLPWTTLLGMVIISTLLGVWSTSHLPKSWGDDPSRVVIDEFAGMLLSLLFLPLSWETILLGFAFFRFFDIVKPLGVRWVDNYIKGPWGVMLDDILAGIYSCISLHIVFHFLPLPWI